MSVLWMILESGAILSFTTIVLLVFYLKKKIAGTVVAAIGGQLAVSTLHGDLMLSDIIVFPGFSTSVNAPARVAEQGRPQHTRLFRSAHFQKPAA